MEGHDLRLDVALKYLTLGPKKSNEQWAWLQEGNKQNDTGLLEGRPPNRISNQLRDTFP